MQFVAFGHPNIRGTHKTTLEFTTNKELSINGDCIIGVNAQFDLLELKKIVRESEKIKITITAGNISDIVEAQSNKKFNDAHEIVIRLGEFDSERTFGLRANKSAQHLRRDLIEKMKNPEQKIIVAIDSL